MDFNLATAIRTTIVFLFAWAVALSTNKHRELVVIDRRSWLFLILSGLATGLSWLCYFRALQNGPAFRVAPVDKLSVVLVIFFAWIFLGEGISVAKLLGGILIATGAAVLAYA
jgi:transporter family protein